jgi:putative salt-induced outer membrane protein YdiY
MEKRITVAEAAKELGMSAQALRFDLQDGKFPFGHARKKDERYSYYINPHQFYKYIGKKLGVTSK